MTGRGVHLGVLVVWFLVLSVAATALGQIKIRLAYGRFTNELIFLAMDKGFFKKSGIEVEFVGFPSLGRVPEAIAARRVDLGVFAVPALLNAVDKGLNVVAIAKIMGMSDPPVTYVALADSGTKTVKDLKGKAIAISTYGGNFDLYLRYMLRKHGLDPKRDVTIL